MKMIRWTLRLTIVFGAVMFWPAIALADNCGSLHDCWGTAGAAGAAAAGAGAVGAASAAGGDDPGGDDGGDHDAPADDDDC